MGRATAKLGCVLLGLALVGCSNVGDGNEARDVTGETQKTATPGGSDHVQSRGLRVYEPNPSRTPKLTAIEPDRGGAIACTRDQGSPQGITGRDLNGAMWSDPAMTNAWANSVSLTGAEPAMPAPPKNGDTTLGHVSSGGYNGGYHQPNGALGGSRCEANITLAHP